MNRLTIPAIVLALPILAVAQAPSGTQPGGQYQPAVPAATGNNYAVQGFYSGGTTIAGSALAGLGSVISAKGDYNLSTSAAAVNMTQAQKNEIQNRQLWTNTYFEMRATNRAARAAEAGPRPTMEQLARMARDGAPKPLRPDQMDPISGKLYWPGPLQADAFNAQRTQLDEWFGSWAKLGGLSYSDQTKVRQTLDAMNEGLKTQVRDIPPVDYMASRTFLQSLSYAATRTQL